MVRARLNVETDIADVTFSSTTRLADVTWNDAPLARIAWEALPVLGDETKARKRQHNGGEKKRAMTRRDEYEATVRAYRLLAVALRSQGLNEHADRYAYRAQLMQRVVLRRQAFLREKGKRIRLGERLRKLAAYLGSGLLDLIAGYGYRPGRTLLWYLGVIFGFAFLYMHFGHVGGHPFQFDEALVFSVTSFHGRGFFPGTLDLKDLITKLAASEAVFGLFIEASFIATFTQRYFGK